MKYLCHIGAIETLNTACLVIGIYQEESSKAEPGKLTAIDDILQKGDFSADCGETQLVYGLSGLRAERVLLLGLGTREKFNTRQFNKAVHRAISTLQAARPTEVTLSLPNHAEQSGLARTAVMAAEEAMYRFDACKSDAKPPKNPLESLTLHTNDKASQAVIDTAIKQGQAIAHGTRNAKDMANLPGNICTPSYLAEQAIKLGEAHKNIQVKVLEEADMQALGMQSLLSVSRGSRQPAKLIVMEYQGGKADDKPVALVGKGLTFDAGGISIKPAAQMDEMKYDMCGGASVIGTLQAIAEMALPMNVVGIVPSSENLPDGDANKPGDIVTSMSGQTIEILNTDAEGRLILCDALTYVERYEPTVVIDIATLTGACIIALGHHASGLMGNDPELIDEILSAGKNIDDRAWELPLWDDYAKVMESNFADVANVGDRAAGSITAGIFLSRFTKEYKWAHLDIAGTAWKSGKDKGATGRPVPLLVEFLLGRQP